jgi:hypothetical protein
MKLLAKSMVSILVVATAGMVSCSSSDDPPGVTGGAPGAGGRGSGGRSGSGGSEPGTGGMVGGGAGGTGGTVTPGTGGTGGGTTTDGPSGSGGSSGSTGGAGGGGSGGGGSPPPDGGNPTGACDYTPKANATQATLKFVGITLAGLPTGDMAQGSGYRDGVTEFRFLPGSSTDFLVAQKVGRISHYRLPEGTKAAMLVKTFNISGVQTPEDTGLISMAFDPNFATNKFIYLGYGTALTTSELSRFTFTGDAFDDKVRILNFSSGGGGRGWHSVGSIGFDPMGNLWMLHGEFNTGAPAQNLASNLGKLLRVVPSRMPGMGGFTPAAGNVMNSPVYARGFRSPWKASLDAKGRYIVGDVQNTNNEEINVVSESGQNFGHPNCTGGGCKAPMVTWDGANDPYNGQGNEVKEGRVGRTVWVGPQYGDCGNDRYGGALTGTQLLGDFFAGWVRAVVINDAGARGPDRLIGDLGTVSAWDQGKDGYLYVSKFGRYHQGAAAEPHGFFRACLMSDTSPACM